MDPLYAIGAIEACERAFVDGTTLRFVALDGRVIDGVPACLESEARRVRVMLPGARERRDFYGDDLPAIDLRWTEIDSIRPLSIDR